MSSSSLDTVARHIAVVRQTAEDIPSLRNDGSNAIGEIEASEYASRSGFEYVGLAQAYDPKTDRLDNGSEVFSLIRQSTLKPSEYVDRFFDTGAEAQRRGE